MLTFKQFLDQPISEGIVKPWKASPKEVDEAINLMNTHCKNGLKAVSNGGLLWRGWGGLSGKSLAGKGAAKKIESDVYLVDTTNSLRTSRDYDNAYMLLMDASKSMKDVPSRTNALICSSSYDDANDYAGKYGPSCVIPFDGAKVAFAPKKSDFAATSIDSNQIASSLGFHGNISSITLSPFFDAITNKTVTSRETSGQKRQEHIDITVLDSEMSKYSLEDLALFFIASVVTNPYTTTFTVTAKKTPNNVDQIKHITKTIRDFRDGDHIIKNGKAQTAKSAKVIDATRELIASGEVKFEGPAKVFYDLMQKAPSDKRFSHLASKLMQKNHLKIQVVDYGTAIPNRSESWVAGKAIIVSGPLMKHILAKLKMLGHPVHSSYTPLIKRELQELQPKVTKK